MPLMLRYKNFRKLFAYQDCLLKFAYIHSDELYDIKNKSYTSKLSTIPYK
jgi:hypothetical protein